MKSGVCPRESWALISFWMLSDSPSPARVHEFDHRVHGWVGGHFHLTVLRTPDRFLASEDLQHGDEDYQMPFFGCKDWIPGFDARYERVEGAELRITCEMQGVLFVDLRHRLCEPGLILQRSVRDGFVPVPHGLQKRRCRPLSSFETGPKATTLQWERCIS